MPHLNKDDYQIELTIDIKESILDHFSHTRNALQHYSEYAKCHREIDFLKMRRFLHTAYKTLNEVDPEFMAQKLTLLHDNVEMMAKVYDDFSSKTRVGKHSYDKIFLQRQEKYVLYEGMLRRNVDEISSLREETERFKANVNAQKEKLKNMPKFLSDYAKKEEDLKRLKRKENACIVRLGLMVEENVILSDVLTTFRETYEEEFSLIFQKYTNNLQPDLLSILNAMAFEFDIEMWLKASDSQVIRNHFKNAFSNDVISSRTYLTYYLKGLDQKKLSPEQKELRVLLDYLNQTNSTYCVLFIPSPEDLHRFVSALEADSGGFIMHAYTDAKVALSQAFKTRINILILDLDAPDDVLENFLSLYRANSKHLTQKAKIILITTDVNDKSIAKAERLGADSLLERNVEPYQIIETVYDLLKVKNIEINKLPPLKCDL